MYRSIDAFCSGRDTPRSPCLAVETLMYARYVFRFLLIRCFSRPFPHSNPGLESEDGQGLFADLA